MSLNNYLVDYRGPSLIFFPNDSLCTFVTLDTFGLNPCRTLASFFCITVFVHIWFKYQPRASKRHGQRVVLSLKLISIII